MKASIITTLTIIIILLVTLAATQCGPSPLASTIATSIEQRTKGIEK